MTQQSIFEPEGRAVPYIEEGEGPIVLVLISAGSPEKDGLGVVSHYLDEEAGFRIVRIGERAAGATRDERVADARDLMDHLGIERTWVGGYGAGGTVARAFAAAHADRVNGVALLGVEPEEVPLVPLVPVLIIQASDDTVTPRANAEALQALAPERVSIKTVDDADHFFPVTHPVETAVIIEEYLDWD
ncbi:alpha/beta fold hydrolase [Microbacterium sp. YY-01]|uniref:alpha/beta fold hydrolase n=1 Tax=Microbacterium sp. YY-01 TaxID=3421634 RepID=UPI003D167611